MQRNLDVLDSHTQNMKCLSCGRLTLGMSFMNMIALHIRKLQLANHISLFKCLNVKSYNGYVSLLIKK